MRFLDPQATHLPDYTKLFSRPPHFDMYTGIPILEDYSDECISACIERAKRNGVI